MADLDEKLNPLMAGPVTDADRIAPAGGKRVMTDAEGAQIARTAQTTRAVPGPDAVVMSGGDASFQVQSGVHLDFTPAAAADLAAAMIYAPVSAPGPSELVFPAADMTIRKTEIDALGSVIAASPVAAPGPSELIFPAADIAIRKEDMDALRVALANGEMIPIRDIVIFGDSLATTGQGFANELAARYPNRSVVTLAQGGQGSGPMAARVGVPGTLAVNGGVIPASGSVIISQFSANPFDFTASGSYLMTVADVPGVAYFNGSNFVFDRLVAGGAIPATGAVPFQVTSSMGTGTTAVGAVALSTYLNRTLVLRIGHNDIYSGLIFGDVSRPYSRAATKANILAAVGRMRSAYKRIAICSITRGYSWLTPARVASQGDGGGVTGQSAQDAATIEACIEAEALNRWMRDTFEGFVDLMAAYEAASPGGIASIDFGSGHVFKFVRPSIFPDGTHGSDAGTAQMLDATTIENLLTAKGW